MTRGIVFYLMGNGYDVFVPPALYSLRKVYSGPVHIVYAENTSSWLRSELPAIPGFTMSGETPNKYTVSGHKTYIWCRKAYAHSEGYPFDINLYFDMDHIWQKPMDHHPIFDKCEKIGMVACGKPDSVAHESFKRGTINETFGLKLERLIGANGGCLCTRKGDPLVQELVRRIDLALKAGPHFLRHNPEEFSIGSMVSEGIAGMELFEDISFPISPNSFSPKVCNLSKYNIHGTRGSLILLKRFWDLFDEAVKADFMNIRLLLKSPQWESFSIKRAGVLEEACQ
jgi:hypothetical protein